MLTPFGKTVRKLRIDRGVRLKEMAESLGVSSAYLSAVETGKKAVSEDLVARVAGYFELAKEGLQELLELAKQSRPQVTIGLTGLSGKQREAAVEFARRFPELGEEELSKIKEILERKAKEG